LLWSAAPKALGPLSCRPSCLAASGLIVGGLPSDPVPGGITRDTGLPTGEVAAEEAVATCVAVAVRSGVFARLRQRSSM